jgi:hypothetical protein
MWPGDRTAAEGGSMSTAVTMQELELEQAELLPSRETLCCCRCSPIYVKVDVCIDLCL